ncbi:hypothetical protein ACSDR0_44440 [Streptosporangium sp. G11]|uniref:hypothetical protein n=1 Tax=Streptosporangium sp. G11 TaxID=3436926 RepID=UPI003EB72794
MTVLDEEQDTVIAPVHAGGDQHPVLYRGGERTWPCSCPKIHRCTSTPTPSGHDCRRDLSAKFIHAREILREKSQDDGLFLG